MFLSRNIVLDLSIKNGPIDIKDLCNIFKNVFFLGNWWNSQDCFDGDHAMLNATSMIHHNNTKTPVEEYWK